MPKRAPKAPPKKGTTFPPTSMRLDPELLYRAGQLVLESKRSGDRLTLSGILNEALSEYLKDKGV